MMAAVLLTALSCEKSVSPSDPALPDSLPWQFALTRAGGTGHTDAVATYRASLLHNGTGQLMSDGSYSGYYTHHQPYTDLEWLSPCLTYDAPGDDPDDGMALDENNQKIPWDASNWFERTIKDSQYALRGPYLLDNQVLNYSLVFTSPAVRMECHLPEGATDIPENYHWGFPIRRDASWAVSPCIVDLAMVSDYLKDINGDNQGYQYVYHVDPVLKEPRSRITVKVACGALPEANINKVYFNHVISSALYRPRDVQNRVTYELWKFDGNDAEDPSFDPLASYYTHNNYPVAAGAHAGEDGDKLEVPAGEPYIHLVRKPGQSHDFIENNDWQNFDQTADEWVKGNDSKYLLTAIKDFKILSMDYSLRDGDVYVYEEFMPRLVLFTGRDGDIKTTIRLAQNFEPMKEYTLYVYISSVYVQAVLTVSDWTIHRHWTEVDAEDTDVLEVVIGTCTQVNGSGLDMTDWRPVSNTGDEGLIQD